MMKEKESEKNEALLDDDVPFGDPPIMFNYKCRICGFASDINEAHIDVAYAWTRKRTMSKKYGKVPVLECPSCEKLEFICTD